MKILYLYNLPRKKIIEGWKKGNYPDTLLFGFNYKGSQGIEADYLDPKGGKLWESLFTPFEKISKINISQQLRSLFILKAYDLIVCKDICSGYLLALIKKLTSWGIPLIIIGVELPEKISGARLLGFGLSGADKITYLTSPHYKLFVNTYKIHESKLEYLPWAVDHHFFKPVKAEPKNFLLSVGVVRRDYLSLLKVLRDVKIPLHIAASKLDLGVNRFNNVTKQFLTPIELRHAYSQCKFVVIPLLDTITACGVTAVLESMAMEKAVIVSKSRGILDYVEDGRNAILVKPGNKKELKEAIIYLNENPEEARRIGKNGRKTVEEKFNTEKQVKQLVKLYDKIACERNNK